MTDTYFERIEHTADLAIRVWGDDLPGMFVNAARALFALMSEAPPTVLHERRVVVESVDTQALLVDWLNELICLSEVEHEVYTDFAIEELTTERLTARLRGGPAAKTRTIKAATFHDLHVERTERGVEARLVFDV